MRAVAMVIGYERLRQRERGAACQPTTAWGPTSICRRILTVAVAVCPEPGRGGTNLDLCRLLRPSASEYSSLRCVSFCPRARLDRVELPAGWRDLLVRSRATG